MTPAARLREAIERAPYGRQLLGQGMTGVLARGAASAFLIGVLARFVSFPVSIALARWMGGEDFGAYIFVTTWTGLLAFFTLLGMDTSLVRFVAAYRAAGNYPMLAGLLRRATQIIVAMGVVMFAFALLTLWILHDRIDDSLFVTFLIGCAFLPFAGMRFASTVTLRALRKIAYSEMLDRVVQQPLLAIFVGLLLLAHGSVSSQQAMLLHGLAGLVVLAISVSLVRAMLPEIRGVEPEYATRRWLRASAPLLLAGSIGMILPQSDILLVGIIVGPTEAGVYAIASRLALFTSFGLIAINTISAPMIAAMYERQEQDGLQRLARLTTWGATISSVLIGAILVVLREPLLSLFGSEFGEGSTVLWILTAAFVIDALTGPIGSYLDMTGHQDWNAVILTMTAVVNIIGGIFAVKLWGMEGAAWMTAVAIVLRNTSWWVVVRRQIGVNASIFAGPPWLGRRSAG